MKLIRVHHTLLILVVFLSSLSAAPPDTTTISDTIRDVTGAIARGEVEFKLSRPCYPPSSSGFAVTSVTKTLRAGVLTVDLVPNDTCVPAGTRYIVTYKLNTSIGRMVYTQQWNVTTSGVTIDIDSVVDDTSVASTNLTQGSVPVVGSVGGILTEDNAYFFYNTTTHRLGLGTTSPARTLDIRGNAIISDTTSGGSVLALKGSYDGTVATNVFLRFEDSGGNQSGYVGYGATTNNDLTFYNNENGALNFYTNATLRLRQSATAALLAWGAQDVNTPALKASTTKLQARLGDDSAYTNLMAAASTAVDEVLTRGATWTDAQCLVSASGKVNTTGSACASATPAFSSITGGTNTGAAMVVGSGASIAVTGSGTNVSTSGDSATAFFPSGTIEEARLGSGTGTSAKYLRGDSAWIIPAFTEISGAVTDAQVPNTITVDLSTVATTANAGDSATAFFSAGTIEEARLGSGTGTNAKYLRGDSAWTIPAFTEISGSVTDAQVPDTITATNYLLLAGGTLTGQLITDNLGVEFEDSDTNPTCAAGNFNIYADLSENKLKKCMNGSATDLDTTGGTPSFDSITGGTNTTAAMVVGTGGSINVSGSGTIVSTSGDSATSFFSAGTIEEARLGSGTGTNAKYLRGDSAWTVPAFTELSGSVTDAQVPNTITIDLSTVATTANAGDSATAFFSSGTLEEARLGSGTGTSAKYLRGDSAWTIPAFSELSGAATDAQVPDNITVTLAATATALAANPADCSAGYVATAIAASGALTCAGEVVSRSLLSGTTLPDTSGNVFFQPWSIITTNDFYPAGVWSFNNPTADEKLFFSTRIPDSYTGTALTIELVWTTTVTANDFGIEVGYRCIASTESLDPTTNQTTVNTTSTAPGTTLLAVNKTVTLTASDCVANDLLVGYIARDDSADTLTAAVVHLHAADLKAQ